MHMSICLMLYEKKTSHKLLFVRICERVSNTNSNKHETHFLYKSLWFIAIRCASHIVYERQQRKHQANETLFFTSLQSFFFCFTQRKLSTTFAVWNKINWTEKKRQTNRKRNYLCVRARERVLRWKYRVPRRSHSTQRFFYFWTIN